MAGYDYYNNSGAILRRLFPKQLNTQGLILIWTVVFILNIVIVVLVQNMLLYPISEVSKKSLQEVSYFENCEIEYVSIIAGNGQHSTDYYVRYTNADGELRIVCLDGFPNIFRRARIMKATDMLIMEDEMVQYTAGAEVKNISMKEYFELANPDSMIDIFLANNTIRNLAGIYVAIGVGMLLIEFFIYSVFHRLFRE